MAATFVIEEGNFKGLNFPLEDKDTSWVGGRDPIECQLIIPDPSVSGKHFIARRTEEGITIENLSDDHPIQINEIEILEPTLLHDGDRLKIGNEILLYTEQPLEQIHDDNLENDDDLEDFPVEDLPNEEESLSEEEGVSAEDEKDVSHKVETEEEEFESEILTDNPIDNNEEIEESDMPRQEELQIESPPEKAEEEASEQDRELNRLPDQPDEDLIQRTIYGEEESEIGPLAEIDFGVIEAGRWLLKVVGGPNSGAEFYMHSGNQYIIGTDPQNSDIVFHDTSVSRQHAKITITPEDQLLIEDLRSRNGVLIDGATIDRQESLPLNTIVTLGTTSFAVYDREGEMQTIISPLLPSIVKVLQQETTVEQKKEEEKVNVQNEIDTSKPLAQEENKETEILSSPTIPVVEPKSPHSFANFVILTGILGLFALAGMGTLSLFKSEVVVVQHQENADELIQNVLENHPAVRYTFNKGTGALLLIGHVMNTAERNQVLFKLQSLKFIKSVDDSGIVIDESVWHEVNSILSDNPAWKGITIYSPKAGQFILSGYLQTRKQAEQLSAYISLNFPYLDLLKKQIVVEEDVVNQITSLLQKAQLNDVEVTMKNSEITLTGGASPEKAQAVNQVLAQIKTIPGVRIVNNLIKTQSSEPTLVNITDHYPVTGKSRIGNKYTVIINGRILSEGDDLDGMTITQITNNRVLLDREGMKYRIDY